MKKWRSLFLALLIALCLPCAVAESDPPLLSEDGWSYIGYTYGGITFAVPSDYMPWNISAADAANGFVLMGGNADCTLQMRVFQKNELTYDAFKAMVEKAPSAEFSTRMDGDSEILVYRNTEPSANSELYGIAMTGLDGLLYKISVFTGEDEAFDADAPVWAIAETIGKTVRHEDFSEWDLEDTPTGETDSIASQIIDFLNRIQK